MLFFYSDARNHGSYLPSHRTWQNIRSHYIKYFNISDKKCNHTVKNILIINRIRIRRIINLNEIINHLQINTLQNVKSILFEALELREQLQEALCADILIGVQGAGLTW